MSTRIFIAKTGDVDRIDQYLSKSRHATVYHRMQWLEAISRAYGYEYSYYLAEKDRKVAGVLPICHFRTIKGNRIFCSLPFCDLGGIIADSDDLGKQLFEGVTKSAGVAGVNRIELREYSDGDESEPDMTGRKVRMLLELPDKSEALMAGFKSKLRSQIRKAEKNGLTFDYSCEITSIDDFYHVFSRNMQTLGSPVHSVQWFQALSESYKDDLVVGRVWYGEEIVGAGILLFSGDKVSIPWASTLRRYNHLAPNMLLYWGLLRLSCERGCKLFDFGRSTFGEGTYNFKKQWGARPVLLDWKTYDSTGRLVESSSDKRDAGNGYVKDVFVWCWRKLPLSIANKLGPLVRGHISL